MPPVLSSKTEDGRSTVNRGVMLHPGDPHKCHVGFAEAAGLELEYIPPFFESNMRVTVADTIARGLTADIPAADLYVIEHADGLFTAPVIRSQYPEATVLYLFAQGELFRERYDFSRSPPVKRAVRLANTTAIYHLSRSVIRRWIDGVIANSQFMKEWTRAEISSTIPTRVAEPYINEELYELLSTCQPTLSENTAVTVGRAEQCKGTDLLVEAWPCVCEQFPDATLKVAGEGQTSFNTSGVKGLGYVRNIKSLFETASLYVHPGRMEAFGVAVVEAMRGGLPSIVTTRTGAKSAVQEVDKSFVVQSSPEAIAERIIEYFESDLEARQRLSDAFRSASDPFTREMKEEQFVSAVQDMSAK